MYIFMCVYVCISIYLFTSPLLYPFISRWTLGFLHSLAIVDNAGIKIGFMCPFESVLLYPLGKYLVVQLLGHRVVLFLTFWGNSILFSRVAASVCIPTISAWGSFFFTSLPTLVSCVFDFSHSFRALLKQLFFVQPFYKNTACPNLISWSKLGYEKTKG